MVLELLQLPFFFFFELNRSGQGGARRPPGCSVFPSSHFYGMCSQFRFVSLFAIFFCSLFWGVFLFQSLCNFFFFSPF